ncbi:MULTISPECIES: RNA polymerase sigma factor [Sulfitobacter]|uniref:Sigma-70 family RNA polymerase sigma factor n=2 Tax=Sulfitobacter TaxID=60136 RepID=A0AAE2W1X5_9RHOB|nr:MULTISPECIES: sigma-70 family RNA polymerase sigma factor [Sulfitobacter]MDF3434971.1 sigma-70 family RNA polymerase sigma factor [Sulfitobacter sp. KE42]MDF3464508.1 sigma-70 family RNA polymerase sigma factor [Sulfitobacter sp. Ks18]MDF3511165.1 sigma-70 family RNA polymerase sigma factor [Sulfitobacter sp. M57]MDF3534573.1 sigma-70 family RNA polymerase sigma factor [Sulfitobacter sp. S62]MDF3542382.1 sigma-70 family RNA polymerase sigma factor [Sulfitobacter sp. M62]
MSNGDHFSGDVLPTTDPSVEALSVNRKMFLGFLVKRLGNVTEAEDVLQEFCIRVMQRKDQLRETDKLTAWLYAVLRSTLNDHYRKIGRGRRLSAAFENEQKTADVSEDGAEEFDHVCQCVTGLMPFMRPDQSDLIRRVDIEDDDRRSVAADLGVSVGALGVRLHRARAALRDSLLDHCGGCCKDGFSDCSCPPGGCQNKATQSSC